MMGDHDPFGASITNGVATLHLGHDADEAEPPHEADNAPDGFDEATQGRTNGYEETEEDLDHEHATDEPRQVAVSENESPDERVARLEDELARTTGEKEAFEAQYKSLLAKLTTMRNTLGDKLKQDADELDRREEEISVLRTENEDLAQTIETLKTELIASHEDSERVHSELDQLRSTAFDSQKQTTDEASSRDLMLREAQEDLERVRIEREEWESEAMRERVRREQYEQHAQQLEVDLAHVKTELTVMTEDRDRHAESAINLQTVLEEFQSSKEREIRETVGSLDAQLQQAREQITTLKQRATEAENKLAQSNNDAEKVLQLQKEVKEKNAIIGKVRHEAVILNEHLTEALRRLRRDSSDHSVDRRLVSNVLITFLNTPRGDTKRFQMLQVLSSILNWTDEQREQVGLQRSAGGPSGPGIASSRRSNAKAKGGKGTSDDSLGENESFSNLWIEFLLKESSQGRQNSAAGTATGSASGVTSPTSPMSPGMASEHSQLNFPPMSPPPPGSAKSP